MKQRDITTPSLTYAPELMMKSSAVTLGPMYTGASALLFTVPLSNLEVDRRYGNGRQCIRYGWCWCLLYIRRCLCVRGCFSVRMNDALIIVRSRSVRSGAVAVHGYYICQLG